MLRVAIKRSVCVCVCNTGFDINKAYHAHRQGRKEMFYLTTHSTHFIYGYMVLDGNVLFNDVFNTFYLRLYGV